MLIICLLLAAVSPLAAQSGAIHGIVINQATGEAVARAQVVLLPARQPGAQIRVNNVSPGGEVTPLGAMLTGDDGRFQFKDIATGDYVLQCRKAGFAGMASGQVGVAASGTAEVTLRLTPQAVVSGKVIDEDGEPVEGAQVQLVIRRMQRGRRVSGNAGGGQTDDRGMFRIVTTATGPMLVHARPLRPLVPTSSLNASYVVTYHPSTLDMSEAKAIDVSPGREVSDVVVRLRSSRVYRISGRAFDVDGKALKNAAIQILPESGEGGPLPLPPVMHEDGRFEVRGVPPGAYRVVAQVFDSQNPRAAAAAVRIVEHDIEDIELRIRPGVQVSGRVEIPLPPMPAGGPRDIVPVEGVGTRPVIRLGLNPVVWDGVTRSYTIQVGEDGTFTLNNVQPGRYEIAAGFQYGAYLSSVLLDGEEILGKELDLTEPRGSLVVVYKADGGLLRVDVQAGGRPDQSQPPALLLMPADPALRRPQFMYLLTLSKWKDIQLPGLRPGEYLVWAFDRFGRYEQLDDSDFLKSVESAARKVKIEPDGMHELQLPLTSWP